MEDLILTCPHCSGIVLVARSDMNCRIFRHAVYASTMQPIPPHASLQECQQLLSSGTILGCAGPFQIIEAPGNTLVAQACPYI